ncbi:MAG TPA: hypothetical protein VJU80_09855, partial [Solirubrobacteraceae bacterium]|nr:hypothetical protein [Solirubrobacteraceae bacterium]
MGRANSYLMSRGAAVALAVSLAMFVAAPPADATLVGARNGNLAAFSGGVSTTGGALTATADKYGADRKTFSATYSGPGSAAVSGALDVDWTPGESVAWGSSFRLAPTFHGATEGQQELVGWQADTGQEGIVVDYSDNLAYLVASPGSITQQVLVGPFSLPAGQWFSLQIRQLLGSTPESSSRV